MEEKELTLDFLNREMTKAKRIGKRLTDIVAGKKEMKIIRSWSYSAFPSEPEYIVPLPESVKDKLKNVLGGITTEIYGITLYEINKESYWEQFNLDYYEYPIAKVWDEYDEQMIQDKKRMLKLIEEIN